MQCLFFHRPAEPSVIKMSSEVIVSVTNIHMNLHYELNQNIELTPSKYRDHALGQKNLDQVTFELTLFNCVHMFLLYKSQIGIKKRLQQSFTVPEPELFIVEESQP